MSKSGKNILKRLSLSLGVLSAFSFAAGAVITNQVLGRTVYNRAKKRNENELSKETSNPHEALRRERGLWYKSIAPESVSINNRAGERIHAKIITAKNETPVWVICIHGYTSEPYGMAAYAYEFFEMGYNLLLPDMRGHADSEHNYIGMGWLDRLDIIDWIFYLIENNPDVKIILHGVSMGAATVMMVTGENLPFNVKCAVEDCGYSSVIEEFSHVLSNDYKVPKMPGNLALSGISKVARLLAGFDFKNASSIEQLKKSKTPTLFIHGTQDKFVPFSMLDKVYEAAACEKQRLEIEDATHANAHLVNPQLYWNTVREFIQKHID